MRFHLIITLFYSLFFSACQETKAPYLAPLMEVEEFHFPEVSIRALAAINDSTLWFAGSKGTWGYTEDAGQTWIVDTLRIPGSTPELRSIKITPNGNVYVVNIMSPASVYRSSNKGETWEQVYTDVDTNAFFDAVNFWDDQNGILLGDAQNNCFHIAITRDGGNTWSRLNCDSLPATLDNENPFAASNTNIAIQGNSAWIGTGGKDQARAFYSTNRGQNWRVTPTPIIAGKQMTGIYSVDFLNDQMGVAAGGDWDSVNLACTNLALTKDGGKTWTKMNNTHNDGYISCVQWIPETDGQFVFTLSGRARGGESSMNLYHVESDQWTSFPNSKNYLSAQFSSKNTVWISGKEWIGRLKIMY